MSRFLRALAVALALTLVVTGCGTGTGRSSSTADGPVTLRFVWWGNELRNKLTTQVVEKFMQENPDIKISMEPGEWSGYWDKLATQVAGNSAPDVIQQDESQIAAYSTRGALLDLGSQKGLDVSAMDAKVLDTGKIKDKLYGVPVGVGIFSVAVNPQVLQQAGVTLPDDKSWTWEDLIKASAQVTERVPGSYGLDTFGLGGAELGAFARQRNEEIFPTSGQTGISEQTVKDYYALGTRMLEAKATPPVSTQVENNTKPIANSLFGSGKAAFHLLFHTQMQAFASSAGTPMTLLRLPSTKAGEPRMVNKASMYWSISAKTRYPEAAARFVNYLVSDPEAAKILLVERGVPAIPAVQTEVEPLLDGNGKTALAFARTMQSEVVDPPQVTPAGAGAFGTELTKLSQDVLFGRADVGAVSKQVAQMAKDQNK